MEQEAGHDILSFYFRVLILFETCVAGDCDSIMNQHNCQKQNKTWCWYRFTIDSKPEWPVFVFSEAQKWRFPEIGDLAYL